VLFAGVYYHLKNPMLALQRIRKLLAHGGVLFIEGAATTDYLALLLSKALELPQSKVSEILDRLPLAYFDFEDKIYESGQNWFFPTTRCLEAMLLDSGFQNVVCKLNQNAIYSYSHRRLMGRAEANPAQSAPGEQKHEHCVLAEEFPVTNKFKLSRRLVRRLPLSLQFMARRVRRAVLPRL
jgi:hypothetical protein